MTMPPSELVPSLLRRLAEGDTDALGELFDRAAPLLYPVALRVTGDPKQAETAVEQAFTEVWRDRRDVSGRAPKGLVPLLARTRILALTAAGKGTTRMPVWEGPDADAVGRVLAMSEDDRAGAAGRALLGLSPAEQRVLDRAWFEGRSLNDIADDMGVELDEARRLLRSALAALRQEIDAGTE
jgi:RNA polymerase sigma-70 factor, ECF subfamily